MKFEKKFKNYDLEIHGVRLPRFEIDKSHKHKLKVSEDCDNYDFLRKLSLNGFDELNLEKDSELYNKYVDRAKYELATLKDLGFIDYVLLVWDVINFCKESDIPTGMGRGSAAGSLVLFLIGVTGVDPIEHDLYFERFVSKTRAKKKIVDGVTYLDGALMCDVDLDLCYYRRQEVIQYLESKFSGKTAKIVTMNTLSGKLLMKECGKIVAGKNETEMNMVSAMIPKLFGQVKDIKETYEEEDKFREWCDENKEAYEIATKLRGLTKNKGVHPSAISLSYEPMEDSCPAELSSGKDSSVCSYDMNWISIFNVKLDLLGLRSVSVVDDVCKRVGIKMTDIDLNDDLIYQQLQDLRTPHGCFQIEAETNYRICQKVKPKNLDELSAVLALARPGAMQFADQYANYTNNDVNESIHPFFDDILASTGGVCLYQEQMMKMAHKVGFTLDEAETLRRIVGKKKRTEVRKWKKKIIDKIKENNLDPDISEILWQILEDSANYSFNKSHSVSYAALAAATVYLKFTHPQQFFLSLLKMTRHEPDPINEISRIHTEMSEFDIKLLPPHLTRSEMDFSIEGKDIRFGLLSIKGISEKSIEKINNFKSVYSNKFEIFSAAREAKLNIGVLSALIQAGALEGFKQSRSKVVLEAQLWNLLTDRERRYAMSLADQMEFDLVETIKFLMDFKDEKGKAIVKGSRYETIKKKYQPYLDIFLLNSKSESFANWYYEKMLLGYTYNKTLQDIFSDKRPGLAPIRSVNGLPARARAIFIGRVEDTHKGKSKNGNKYFKAVISDETGLIPALIFRDQMDKCESANSGFPKKNNIVIVKGTKADGAVFADVISVQDTQVYTKLSELKAIKS
jgi:DNA polymerase-3 subunit alpha